MPFTYRPQETPEEREKRMTDLSDAFVLWASEAGLIDVHVGDDGEMFFSKAACDCEVEDDLAEYWEDAEEVDFDLAEALTDARPLPHIGKHRTTRRLHRIPLAAVPVAAGVVVASTAAVASTLSHNERAQVEVTAPTKNVAKPAVHPVAARAASLPLVSTPAHIWHANVVDTDPAVAVRTLAAAPATEVTPETGEIFTIAMEEMPKVKMMWVDAANITMKPDLPAQSKGKTPDHPLKVKQVTKVAVTLPAAAAVMVKTTVKIVVKPTPVKKPNPPKKSKPKPTVPSPVVTPPVTLPTLPPVVVAPPVEPPVDAVVIPAPVETPVEPPVSPAI